MPAHSTLSALLAAAMAPGSQHTPNGQPRQPRQPRQDPPRVARFALALMAAALASACGGNAEAPPAAEPVVGTVAVSASLGAVANAEVSVTCAPTGAVLGTANTGGTGVVNVGTSGACAGPLLVSVNARSDGASTYFDEATASVLAFPAGSSVRALAPTFGTAMSVAVTALTEIATRQALANAGTLAALSAAQVTTANAAVVAQVLGTGVALDILSAPTMWTATTAAGSLGTGAADRYAYYLAGLARMGQGNAAPALAVLAALAADLADGTLSGSASGFVYTAGNLAALRSAALSAMAAYANPALQTALGVVVTPPAAALAVSTFTPTSGAVDAGVTLTGTGFDADRFHMLVKFSNNLAGEVLSSSATSLVVKVPAGAVNGPIVVTNTITGHSVTTSAGFTVNVSSGGGGGGGGGGTDTWASRASPSNALLNGLAYGGGRFVAVGFIRALLTSTDGLSWTAATAPDTGYYSANAVDWTGSQFVMVGDQDFGSPLPPLIATSPDGSNWTRRSWAHGSETALVDVAVGGGKLTVVGANGKVASSSDAGLTWASETATGAAVAFTGVAGNTSTRVAVGRDASHNGVILVDSGSGWQAASGASGASGVSDFYPKDVTWSGSQFIAVGGSSANFGADAVVMTSSDGTAWTRRALSSTEAPAGFSLRAVLALGSTLYATGDNGQTQHVIVKSTDAGATWTVAYQGQANGQATLAGIAASADRVVTVGGVKSVTLP